MKSKNFLIILAVMAVFGFTVCNQPASAQTSCTWTGGAVTCCNEVACVVCAIINGRRVCVVLQDHGPQPEPELDFTAHLSMPTKATNRVQ